MELSGCVESLFIQEHRGVDERIRACADAGLDAVEFWLWRDKDLDKIERALGDTGLRLTLFSVEPRSPNRRAGLAWRVSCRRSREREGRETA
jgi:hydroxypyruvate isomerase